ncbi:MAG: tetratricopeptide (TPR) repeat protein [Flavobacterium sp.]|jgi:tetratricopeptide (TPR) repeat protein
MATYNKRGYRTPKEKEEKLDSNFIEDTNSNVDETTSTTAGVFNTLDETANKTEEWVEKNQKYILGFLGLVVVLTLSYLGYQRFINEPKQELATDDLFVAQQNFELALNDGAAKDSLFNLVLKGSEGKQGAIGIANQYSGTDSGNLANYYAGIAYLNLKKYDEAISYLEKFSSKDEFLGAIAIGAIGDAYAEKNQLDKALDFYVKAANEKENEFTSPKYLYKAGQVAYSLNKKEEAAKYFTQIKEKYQFSQEGQNIDALIEMSK